MPPTTRRADPGGEERPVEDSTVGLLVGRGGGCVGCAVSGGFGCLAFLFGATLAVVLLAPQLLGGWFARGATSLLSGRVDGRIVVADAELSWSEDQRLREVSLLAPDGHVLARGTLRVPSLTQWMDGSDADLWRFRGRLSSTALRIDEAGVLDLARVLYLDDARPPEERGLALRSLWEAAGDAAREQGPPFLVELDAAVVTLTDARRGGRVIRFEDVHVEFGRVSRTAGASFSLRGRVADGPGAAQDRASGRFALDVALAAPEAPRPGVVDVELSFDRLPPEALELLLDDERVARAAGGPLDLTLTIQGDLGAGARATFSARSPAGQARATGTFEAGTLRLDGAAEEPASLAWTLDPDLVADLLAPLVPDAWTLDVRDADSAAPGAPLRARLDSLVVTTGWDVGWWPVELARADAYEVTGSALVPLVAALGAREGGDGSEYLIRAPLVSLQLLGELGGSLGATWRDGPRGTPGSLTLRLPGAESVGIGASGRTLDLDLPGLPVALLAPAAGIPSDGASLMGERVRLGLGGLPAGGQVAPRPIDVSLLVEGAPRAVRGRYADGVVRAAGGPQVLSLPGDAARLEAALLPILPWLGELRPLGAGRLEIAFDDLEVPLLAPPKERGLLARGEVRLRIPPCLARLRPAIARRLGLDPDAEPTAWFPTTIALGMEDEIVRYERVGIPIGDEECPFRGSYDRKLGVRRLDLEGDVPAELVSSELALDPGQLELLLGIGRRVQVHLSGTVDEPLLFVESGSVRDVLSIDFEQALPALRELLRTGR